MASPTSPVVLVVDDEPVFRRAVERLLVLMGFETVLAETGEQALEMISRRCFDLMLCDFRLPGADGLQILAQLRRSGSQAPFVIMTAYYSENLERAAHLLGVTAILEKPVAVQELQRHCKSALLHETGLSRGP
jgi:CheY-like chemotaxis protein